MREWAFVYQLVFGFVCYLLLLPVLTMTEKSCICWTVQGKVWKHGGYGVLLQLFSNSPKARWIKMSERMVPAVLLLSSICRKYDEEIGCYGYGTKHGLEVWISVLLPDF